MTPSVRERILKGRNGWWFLGPGGLARLGDAHLTTDRRLRPGVERNLRDRGLFTLPRHTTYALTVLTSTDCNLGCGYCFQNTGQDTGGGSRPPRIAHARLTEDTITEIFRFVESRMAEAKLDRLTIMLFGGEPLLNPRGCRELLARAGAYGLTSASMISNGTLLTVPLARELSALGLRTVQITFDGERERHDHVRIKRSGGGTFDAIVRNIARVTEVTPIRWALRVNVSHHNHTGIDALLEQLGAELDPARCDLYFARIGDIGIGYHNTLAQTEELAASFQRWHGRALELGFTVPRPKAAILCQACSYRDGRFGAVINADGTPGQLLGNRWKAGLGGRHYPQWLPAERTDRRPLVDLRGYASRAGGTVRQVPGHRGRGTARPAPRVRQVAAMKLLGHADFRRFWFASTISGTGSQLTLIAYPLLVLSIGGSAAQVGAVASAALITRLGCRLPGGHLADLVDARRLMIAMDLTRLLAVGGIAGVAGFGRVNLAMLLVAVVVEGAATAAYTPAATIVLRDIVPREQLVSGLSWLQATTGTVAMVGPPLGGALFAVHHVVPFAADAVSYACSATLLLTLAVRRPDRRAAARDGRITAGLRWLWHRPAVMRVVVYASVLNLAASGAQVLVLVELGRRGTSSLAIGIVLACAGLGAIGGAILAGRILILLRGNSLYLVVGLVWTVGLVCFAGTTQAWVVGPALVVLMLLTPATGIRLSEITVNQAPADLLGRVSTAQGMLASGFASFGPLLAGVLLDASGIAVSWLVLAAICVAATAIAAAAPAKRVETLAPAGVREPR